MATSTTTVVSGSNFLGTLATGSLGPLTGSLTANISLPTTVVSGTWTSSSLSASLGPITGSLLGGNAVAMLLVNFQNGSGTVGPAPTGSFTQYTFVMTGYYVAGGVRETWSGHSINTPNPSGHTLIDITVMGSYPPQNSAT